MRGIIKQDNLRISLVLAALLASPALPQDSGTVVITLEEAKARALGGKAAETGKLFIDAARYHRQAAQADYLPKIEASFANVHYNKFLGLTLVVANRSAALPLLNRDQTIVMTTVTQPITPLFKVHNAVRIARADERIAKAKVEAGAAQASAAVEKAYFDLLIAKRQLAEAEANAQIGGSVAPSSESLLGARQKVEELTQVFAGATGLAPGSRLVLAPPAPAVDPIVSPQAVDRLVESHPDVVEAEQTVAKARAATNISKLEYVPDVAALGGYMYQTATPLLPRDFSFVGVVATYNVFDFGKRERLMSERKTQLKLAEANLEKVRAKVAAGAQRSLTDLEQKRRALDRARQGVSGLQAGTGLEAIAAKARAEAEMFQAELDYRLERAAFDGVQ